MKKALAMFLVCMVCTITYGQESNSDLLKKLVEKNVLTQAEADSLQTKPTAQEQKSTLAQSTEKVRQAFNTPYMQFGGYGLFMYQYNDVSDIKHTAKPRVVFLSMAGNLTKSFRYYLLGEFVKPMLFEFYGEWMPAKEFKLKFGQMKTPLSIENQLSLTEIESVMNTRTVSYLIGMDDDPMRLQNGINNTGRDIGIMANGDLFKTPTHSLLHYTLGVFQGTGINTAETNNVKDLATNVLVEPIKNFRIGGGIYLGQVYYKKDDDSIPLGNHVHNRWIISSEYKSDRFYARAEWINGNDGGIKKGGVYGTALYYWMPKKLNTFMKVDYFDKDKRKKREVTDYMLGVNYYFFPSCRFQLNYTYSNYSKNWGDKDSNIVAAQMQIVF